MTNKDVMKSLSTRSQCRNQIHIWFDSADNYLHGERELIVNGCDTINNNYEEGVITVTLDEDLRTLTTEDTGAGMPLAGKSINHEGKEVDNYKLILETLFASTNYDNKKNGKETGGVNGVGTCVLNHTSDYFEVISCRNGEKHRIVYEDGGNLVSFDNLGKTDKHGTIVKFKLSDEVYTNVTYTPEEIEQECLHFAASNNKIKFIFKYKDIVKEFKFNSIQEYYDKYATKSETGFFRVDNNIIEEEVVEKKESFIERNRYSFLISCAEGDTFQESYLNGIHLAKGGTINEGVIKGIRACMHKYISDKNLYEPKEKAINDKDVEAVLNFIATVNSNNQSYSGQTKFATEKKLYRDQMIKLIKDQFEIFAVENPIDVEAMANSILNAKRASEKAKLSVDRIRNKLKQATKSMALNKMDKFINCRSKKGGMIFIAEGDSAATALKHARDSECQAIYALKGKMENILKKNRLKSIDNKEIKELIAIFGCGVEIEIDGYSLFDLENFRFDDGIAIATDADPDGGHIFCLAVTFIFMLFPTLLKKKKVFKLLTPLYEIRNKKTDEMHYAYNETEKEEIISKLDSYHIARCKGLGETDSDVLKDCMNPEDPNLQLIDWEDAEAIAKKMEAWMGDDVTDRKQYIYDNLDKYLGGEYE